MAGPKTKGMVALIPSAADAERLAIDGGEAVGDIHLTLLFLGDAADWDDDARRDLIERMRLVAGRGELKGDAFAVSVFNPGNDDKDTCIVLGVGGQAVADFHDAAVAAADMDLVPEQHAPWVAHVSLIYTDDLAVLADAIDRTGPITFDRLRVAFADSVTDIPLAEVSAANRLTEEVPPVTARDRLKTARPVAALRQGRTDWYRISNLASSGAAEVFIYDEIGYFGVSAQDFVRELVAIKADRLDVHINSPGGDAFDGLAIYQALRNHPAKVTVYVDSLAASAASFIAMSGDERVIAPHASLMVHDAFGMCIGDSTDMAKMADELGRLSDNLATIYATRAGGTVADWREAMRAETWYSAEEAVAAGLAHRVQEDTKADKPAGAKNSWDLSVFNFAGRDVAPPPRLPRATADGPLPTTETTPVVDPAVPDASPEAPPDGQPVDTPAPDEGAPESPAAEPDNPPHQEDDMSLSTEVRQRLGLGDDADEATVLAALDARLQPDEPNPDPDPEPTPDPDPEPGPDRNPAAQSQPVASISPEVAAEMARMSQELADIKAREAASAKKALFDRSVARGAIEPAERKTWEVRYDKAPDVIAEILNSKADGEKVPVNAVGVTGSAEPVTDDAGIDWDRIFPATTTQGV